MIRIDATSRDLRKFGITFGGIFLGLSVILLFKDSSLWIWFVGASLTFLMGGWLFPGFLRPIYQAWMTFAYALGWFNTRVLLCLIFYGMFTPIAIVIRLFGKDLIKHRRDRTLTTYWIKRPTQSFDPKRYEQLF